MVGLSGGDVQVIGFKDEKSFVLKTLPKVHDFGVNALDAELIDSKLVIASGGDDQKLSINILELK